ncbi:MAG: NUDIX domain-containing protein [Cyanobacteria bacterium P01_D01_bin.156]
MKRQRTRVSAYGLVMKAEHILLCRVSKALPLWQGQWTLPGGGINFGEAPEDAMVREVTEETGLLVKPTQVATVHSFYEESEKQDFHGIWVIYHTQFLGGTLRHEVMGTTDQCAWWNLKDLENLQLVNLAKLGVKLAFNN